MLQFLGWKISQERYVRYFGPGKPTNLHRVHASSPNQISQHLPICNVLVFILDRRGGGPVLLLFHDKQMALLISQDQLRLIVELSAEPMRDLCKLFTYNWVILMYRSVRVAESSSDDLPALRDEPTRATDRQQG